MPRCNSHFLFWFVGEAGWCCFAAGAIVAQRGGRTTVPGSPRPRASRFPELALPALGLHWKTRQRPPCVRLGAPFGSAR